MIRAADLLPLAGGAARPDAVAVPGTTAAAHHSAATWFDDDVPGAEGRISLGLDAGVRGLSVAQHAERVLQHLRGGC
jgi:hypothetical protein